MWEFLIKLLINALAVFLTAKLLSGVSVKNFFSAFITSVLIALISVTIKPVFIFLTIPLTIITLGLFLLVINALLIMLVDKILAGFQVKNFGWAVLFSITLSFINSILAWIF